MRTYFIRSLIILLIAGLGLESVRAQSTDQNYPVFASAFVAAQPNQNLSAYFSSSQALSVTLLLKDLTKPSLQVYLKWSIEGPGVRVASMEGYIPPGLLLLDMGVLRRFSGLELQSDYFRNSVIEEQGLGGSALRTNLPEGFYTFRVQAMEAGTGRQVSNIAETYFSITTPLPPVINLPFNGAVLRQAQDDGSVTLSLSKSPQIQWMPRHYKQAGNTTTYDLKVCKVPDGYEPQEALDACVNPIIDDKANPGTFYPSNTGIGNSIIGAFERGAKYAVRVTVHEFDANGDEVVFANEGRSEVVWFRYGSQCISPENFTIKEIGSGRVHLSWALQAGAEGYKILYRISGGDNWNVQTVSAASGTIQDLATGKYEFAVQSACTETVPDQTQTWEIGEDNDDWGDLPIALANPMQIPVQASGCNGIAPGNLADYYSNFPGVATSGEAINPADTTTKLKIPACALQSSAFSVCSPEHPVIPLPTGGTPLGTLKAGDVLGIYDFAVFVTEAFGSSGGFSGKGLVRLPFLEGTLALAEFSGVKAWSAEGEGGCIYEVSNFRLLNVSQAEVAAAKGKLINTLSGQNYPAAFAGTLADALAAYDSLSKTAPADSICPFKTAIIDASDQISDELTDLDTDHPGITAILNDLKAITDSLRAGAVVDDITKKYEDIVARLDSLKALDPDNDQPILAIRNAQISNLTGQSARISWEPSGEFSRYVIEYRDLNGGTLQETISSPQVNLQRLLPGTQYTYRILGYQGDQVAASYGEDVFTTVRNVVPVPENLAYTALNMDGVKLTWDKNRDHQSYKIIYVDQFGQERSIYPTTNSARIDGLARDQKYTYRILAVGDGGVESEVVNNQFKIGLVCDMLASAAQPRIIQGEQVALWLTGCVDEDNSEGPVQWTDGKNVFIGNTVFVSPAASTTYTGTCLLNRTSANGEMQSIACSDAKVTVIVDKKCEGVAVSASPITIVQGEPVMLRETGCTGDVQWIDGYPAGQLVGLKSNTIINPLEDKTYTLSCTDKENNHCYVKTGKIEVKCALKLAVNYNQPYVNYKWYQPGEGQDPTEPGDQAANWFEYLSYAGLGIENVLAFNLLKWVFAGTLKKQASIQAIGCPVPVTWEYHHASANNDLSSRNFLYLEKIKNKTWAKATCVVGGKVCTAEAQLDKPDKDCKDFRITLEGDPAKNNVLILKVNSKKDIAWEDGSTNKERIVAIPQKSTVYTVVTTRGACKESIGIDVPLVKPPINIPCPDLTLTKLSGSEKIAAGSSLTKIKFKASGCTDGVDSYPIVWRKNGVVEETPLISADITGEVKELTFTDNDVKKQFTITVECAITTRSASTTFVITKGAATPQPPKPQPENKPHPCDFLLSTSEYQFGNTFQQSQPVKIIVESAQPNLNVMYEQDYNKIIIGGASTTYSNGVATIQFNHDPAKRGAFFVKVTNTVPGAGFCTKGIYIFVDNNRSYTADDGTYQPDPKLVGTTSNCEKYRGGAEIPIVKNTTGTSIRILNNQNDLLDFGAISLFVNGQTVFYPDVTLPDKLALVDKVCRVNKGTSKWYFDGGHTQRMNDFVTISKYSTALVDDPDFENSKAYYTRCIFPDGKYCDKKVVVNPSMRSNGRIGTTEEQQATQETTSDCQFSKQRAAEIIVSSLLCEKLSVLNGDERKILELVKDALSQQGAELSTITDAMVADLAAGECYKVVEALTAKIIGTESVSDLNSNLVNQENLDRIFNGIVESVSEDEIINSDFIHRQIETFDSPSDPNGRVAAIGVCPAYYFTPSGKRIRIPDIGNCVVSVNGVLMSFERYGKKYVPLFKRSTLVFVGYHEELDFYANATEAIDANIKVAPKDKLTRWITDMEYPEENNNIGRFISFIEDNKNKAGVIGNYTVENFNAIKALLVQLPETIFENVEGDGSVFLFDLLKIRKRLEETLSTTDTQLAMLNSIITKPETVCPNESEAICKVFACVYNNITGYQSRDVLNARLPLETRKKLLTLLAQSTLTSGTLPGGCAFASDGEGTVVSLLKTTPETDRKAVLDYLNTFAVNGAKDTPLKAFISKIDGGNFDDFMLIVSDWVTSYYPSTELWSTILQRQDRTKRDLLVLGDWSLGSTQMTSVKDGKTLFDFNITVLGKTPILKPNIDALDYVVVKFTKDFTVGSTTFRAGEVRKIPAVLCYLIMNDQKNKSIATAGKYAAYGLGAAVGVSEIMAASTAVEMTLAIIDMGMLATDFAMNEALATKLNQTQAGKLFLDRFNKFSLIYGGTRIYTELTGLANDLRAFSNKISDPDITDLYLAAWRKSVSFDEYAGTVTDFNNGANAGLAHESYRLWQEEKWEDLYTLFNTNDVNGKWPPYNGFKNITKTETGNELAGKVFDRFQINGELGGSFASPVLSSNEGVNELVFTYDSRALATKIDEGTFYIKFRLKDNLPSDLSFEYGEAIPWFNLLGSADQIKSTWNFNKLLKSDMVEILETLKFENKKWIKIK
ncbi:fibronectin type III domain-containing protein [Dyadobacter sp. 32]|uniref:fibronectin type III domain-containing protein n=1 Tax=Dyadobacter sp. 32 TaxID=538966 RepID=UPI0011EE94D9